MTASQHSESLFDTTTLIAEDLLLLLFDPVSGTIRGEGTTLFNVLAGAVLVDLALKEHVDLENQGWMRGRVVTVTGEPPTDPVLRQAWERIASRPLEVHSLIHAIGPYLREPILDRLVQHGHLHREKRRLLGLIPTTALVDGGTVRRTELVAAVRPLLVDGADPDRHTAPLAALMSASDTLPQFNSEIPWSEPSIPTARTCNAASGVPPPQPQWSPGPPPVSSQHPSPPVSRSTSPTTDP